MVKKNSAKDLTTFVSTSQAFEDIINEKADIVIATKPSKEQEEMLKNSDAKLEFKVLYLEPLAILVNKDNSISNISIEKIQEIYFGNDSNWNTYQLEKNNGSQTCFESIVKNNKIFNNHFEIQTMPEIIDKVGEDKCGIGYSFYSYCTKMHMNNNVKTINVDGKSIKDKDYPLLFEVYLIYRVDNKNNNISKIVNWIETKQGQEFIKNIK